jgi:hypothetical protein
MTRILCSGDDDLGRVEDGFGLGPVAGLPVEDVVVGLALLVVADDRRVGVQRAARVDDDGQLLVLDLDQLERVAGRVAVLGHDEGDLLALEAHLVGGQHRLGVLRHRRHPREVQPGQVGAGDHGADLGVRDGRRRVDRQDLRVGQRAAQDRSVQHAGELEVVDVAALAAHEPRVLLARHATVAQRHGRLFDGGHRVSPPRWR